uniref:3 beta-hydroxysteroid dehydrogenase type 7-like n=1 Tax=Phallusia mammillata TaxID=59560 RepID=A0A6F9DF18_9ASCI|nr:3 beta-hydroxysteroid dehydrogenase type 7-like [Phallusia mammillata]
MGKTYFITGGGGNLGNCLVKIICENNIENANKIKIYDISIPSEVRISQADVCRDSGIEIEWIEESVTDQERLISAMKNVDVVFHMACLMDLYNRVDHHIVWNCNVSGTMKVIEACIENNVGCLIYTSSVHVIGPNSNRDPWVNGDEDTNYPSSRTESYEITKYEAEQTVIKANGSRRFGGKSLTTCALRAPGFYGGDDKALKALLPSNGSKNMRSFTDPSHLQSRMYIDNVAWSHLVAAAKLQNNPDLGGKAYFIGDDTPQLSYTRLNEHFFNHRGFKIVGREPFLPYWSFILLIYAINFMSKFLAIFGIRFMQEFLTPFMMQSACSCFTVSHRKFEADFQYKPLRSWEESRDATRKFVDTIIEEY